MIANTLPGYLVPETRMQTSDSAIWAGVLLVLMQ